MSDVLAEAREAFHRITTDPAWKVYAHEHPRSLIWSSGENLEVMARIMRESTDAAGAIEALQTFFFQGLPPKRTVELALEWHLQSLKRDGVELSDLPSFCQESPYAPDAAVVDYQGRRLRPDFFRHLNTVLRFSKVFPETPRRIRMVELGALSGNLARLFKLFRPNSAYVILDIPETICFSYMYLRLNFPESRVLFLEPGGQLTPDHFDEYDFIFCSVHQRDALVGHEFDVFVNTASLGEMKRADVRQWFHFVQSALKPAYLLSVNRYLNTIVPAWHEWRLDDNGSALHFDASWEILDWECEPTFLRCPYINKHARQVFVIARRLAEPLSADATRTGADLREDALAASWNDPPLEMTVQDNILVSDLTTSGVLFKLWEALRLDPDAQTLFAMLRYLDTLIHSSDRHFEEFFQYAEMLSGLIDPADPAQAGMIEWLAAHSFEMFRARGAAPELVASEGGYNIVRIGARHLAVSQGLGPIDLQSERLGERDLPPLVLVATSETEIRQKLSLIARDGSAPGPQLEAVAASGPSPRKAGA